MIAPMKTLILSFILALIVVTAHAQVRAYEVDPNAKPKQVETVKLQTDSNDAYYQKVVQLDSTITLSSIYVRALQFMAAKNFQQNYGYEEEGKLIFTTTQDLNVNQAFSGYDGDAPNPYSVQFAIILDMKNGRYRYTIHNVVFYTPTDNGNRRISLYDLNQLLIAKDTKRGVKSSMSDMVKSFERYLSTLTHELYLEVENRSAVSDSKF